MGTWLGHPTVGTGPALVPHHGGPLTPAGSGGGEGPGCRPAAAPGPGHCFPASQHQSPPTRGDAGTGRFLPGHGALTHSQQSSGSPAGWHCSEQGEKRTGWKACRDIVPAARRDAYCGRGCFLHHPGVWRAARHRHEKRGPPVVPTFLPVAPLQVHIPNRCHAGGTRLAPGEAELSEGAKTRDLEQLKKDPNSCFFEGQHRAHGTRWAPDYDKKCSICSCQVWAGGGGSWGPAPVSSAPL